MITGEKLVAILKHMHDTGVAPEQQLSTTAMLLILDVRTELTRIADALERGTSPTRSLSRLQVRDVPPLGPGPGYSPPGAVS